MAVVVEGAIALIALLLAWLLHLPLRDMIPHSGRPLLEAIGRGLLATLPMLVLFWWLVHSNLASLRKLREQVEWLVREMFPEGNIGQFAMVAALAGVGEELLFRGVVQMKLSDWTTPVVGLAIASLLFGLAHALSKVYLLFAMGLGVLWGCRVVGSTHVVGLVVADGLSYFRAWSSLGRSTPRGTHTRQQVDENSGAEEPNVRRNISNGKTPA